MSIARNCSQAEQAPNDEGNDMRALRKREWFVLSILLAIVLAAYFNLQRVVVSGVSMQPTFHTGQTVFVWKHAPIDKLKIGDVIVFNTEDGTEVIKRIAYIQGKDGLPKPPKEVWTPQGVKSYDEMFVDYNAQVDGGHVKTPEPGKVHIFVLGDNFEHSEDSRDYGPVDPSQLLGKVVF
ncbi:MAG: signal peptidase I [Capsulimonas sp.]|uniref:signal peptidase I n=1 Tax=Capsulimonas sp. TaxID=2494211 RepID=UPI0032630EAD